jgi:hypothetical protein
MNEKKQSHWSVDLVLLLIYQWILAIGTLACAGAGVAELWTESHRDLSHWLDVVFILVLACWGIAMAVASWGIMRRKSRGFFLGMMCHLVVEILAMPFMLFLGFVGIVGVFSDHGLGGFGGMFLIFALMWLPFVLISGCGFLYLRKLRKGLLA